MFLLGVRPKYDFYRRRKEESRRFFSSNHRRNNIKTRKEVPKQDSQDRKTKGHYGKAKGQNQKVSVLHREKQAQAGKTNCFSLPTPLRSKRQADFLSILPHFLRLPPLFLSKPSHSDTNSHSILRAGHAPTRIYAHALSANLPFLPSPFTSPLNKLYISRLSVKANSAFTFTFTATIWYTIPCTTFVAKKQVKAKGWSLHTQLTLAQRLTPKRWRGEGKNRKTLDARVRVGNNKEKALFLWTEQVATIIGAALKAYPVGTAVHEKPDIKSVDLINPCYICLILSQQLQNSIV